MTDPQITYRVRIAPGADPAADPSGWTWVDITGYALARVRISRGRQDRDGQTPPARCQLTLADPVGRFIPQQPTSPYHGQLRRNTPLNVQVSVGGVWYDRFTGFIDTITVQWQPTQNTVTVTASGVTRRLAQRDAPTRGALYRAVTATSIGLRAYWPLEDGSGSTSAASAVPGAPPLEVVGSPQFGQAAPPSGVASLMFPAGAFLVGRMANASGTSWRVECVVAYEQVPVGGRRILSWLTTGSATGWNLESLPTGFRCRGFYETSSTSTLVQDTSTVVLPVPGQLHHLRVDTYVVGSDMVTDLYVDGVLAGTDTLASASCSPPTYIRVNPDGNNDTASTPSSGHVAIWAPVPASSTTAEAATGRLGDTAADRMEAASNEEDVPLDTIASATATEVMGPAPVGTYLEIMRDAEATDGGMLVESVGGRLTYTPRVDLQNRAVDLALTFAQLAGPFAPTADDGGLVNDVTARRPSGGSEARVVDDASVAAEGRYEGRITVSPRWDARLADLAGWAVRHGTIDELRYPVLAVNLLDKPALRSAWVAIDLGARIQVTGLPTDLPPGPIDVMLLGYTEDLDAYQWTVQANCTPYSPWLVAVRDTDRRDTAGSTLAASATSTSTSLSVATSTGPLWTTAAADLPLDLWVGGEQVRVTAVAGASSPQTMTVTRAVNGVVKAHTSGTAVRLWRPAVRAL